MIAPVFSPGVSHPFRKIVSHIRSAIRGVLVQIARCVYVTRKGHHSVQFIVEISSIWRNL